MDFIAHPMTEKNVRSFLTDPSHGLLIIGAIGSGKTHVAKYIASNVLGKNEQKLASYPYFKILEPAEGKGFGIDDIREVKKFLRLKTTGSGDLRRVVVIDDAHELGHEAQNAMLKLLEEPPEDTCLILTTSNPDKLKPTILSRLQTIRIRNVSKNQVREIIQNPSETDKLYALSEGAIASLIRLDEQADSSDSIQYLSDAKQIIIDTKQNRLIMIDKLIKDDSYDISLLLDGLYKILDMKFKISSNSGQDLRKDKAIYSKLKQIQLARKMLSQKAQPKLVLTKLFYEL